MTQYQGYIMQLMGLPIDDKVEELRKKELLAAYLATNPEEQLKKLQSDPFQAITTELKKQSKTKLLRKQLSEDPNMRELLKYSKFSLEDI